MSDVRDFKLPDLGEGLEEGEIVEWHVEVGDVIELNQEVADVETAKAVVSVPSPYAGKVVEKVGEIGETLEVGTVFLRIDVGVEEGAVAGDGDGDADEASEPAAHGEQSPAQAGFEAGGEATEAAAPDAEGPESGAVEEVDAATERRSTGLDADEEPQPLVGYGQSSGGGARRRRRRGAQTASDASGDGAAGDGRPLAKPPVRKLAKDLGVDLAAIAPGSGEGGIVTRQDVRAAAEGAGAAQRERVGAGDGDGAATAAAYGDEPARARQTVAAATAAAPAAQLWTGGAGEKAVPGFRGRTPGEVEEVRGIRKRIVEKMETSRREIPEALCSRQADLTELWELRRRLTEQAQAEGFDVKITPFAMIMRATLLALRRFPTLNARIDREAGEIQLLEHVNLGFAADTDRGLLVPNIKDAHTKSLLELAMALQDLAGQARDGSIGPGDLTGGTFTVNNYGAFGNDDGNPIINHPEGAILGVGAIRERPWVVDGELAVRRVATFTLAFDHRICDGGEAGRFVTYVGDLCEQPARILLHA